jgi:hypothetical protein
MRLRTPVQHGLLDVSAVSNRHGEERRAMQFIIALENRTSLDWSTPAGSVQLRSGLAAGGSDELVLEMRDQGALEGKIDLGAGDNRLRLCWRLGGGDPEDSPSSRRRSRSRRDRPARSHR